MSGSLPLVTAVVPCHNHQNWVGEALDSLLAQDYPKDRLRIIVVDDGSTDKSVDMVRARLPKPDIYAAPGIEQYSGVLDGVALMHVATEKARGPAAARNLGIRIGKDTELYALLDSDDIYKPRKISRSVEEYLKNPQHIAVVYSDYETFSGINSWRLPQYKEPYSRERLLHECIVNCDSIISKKALEEVGLFCEELRTVEDYDLWLRISEKYMMVHIPEILLSIRVGAHSSSSTVTKERWQQNYQKVAERVKDRSMGRPQEQERLMPRTSS